MNSKKTVVIATGGTGGHIFPSLSLADFMCKEYEIESIIAEPKHKVGNSNTRGVKTFGTWNFLVKEKKAEENKPSKQAAKPKQQPSKKSKTSIRNRISNIANKTWRWLYNMLFLK